MLMSQGGGVLSPMPSAVRSSSLRMPGLAFLICRASDASQGTCTAIALPKREPQQGGRGSPHSLECTSPAAQTQASDHKEGSHLLTWASKLAPASLMLGLQVQHSHPGPGNHRTWAELQLTLASNSLPS